MKGNNYSNEKVSTSSNKKRKKKTNKREGKNAKSITQIMNGEFLTKNFVVDNLNFIFFLIFLLVLVVSKGYYVRQLAHDITKEEKKLQDITADYVETKAQLENKTRRAELVKKLKPLGLTETLNPTKVIRIKEKKNK